MFNLKTIILSSLIGVSIILNVSAGGQTNAERYRELAENARQEGNEEDAIKYENLAQLTDKAVKELEKYNKIK